MKTSKEHIIQTHGDTDITRYVAYLANRDQVSYSEAAVKSLSRIYTLVQDVSIDIAIMTAFRSERKFHENMAKNWHLQGDIRSQGWGSVPVMGFFVEKVRDENDQETGEKRDVNEHSYFIVSKERPKEFISKIKLLVNKYEQESAIVRLAGDENAYLLHSTGELESQGVWKTGSISEYYTKMRKGPPDRKFRFEAAGDKSLSTMMVVDNFWNKRLL